MRIHKILFILSALSALTCSSCDSGGESAAVEIVNAPESVNAKTLTLDIIPSPLGLNSCALGEVEFTQFNFQDGEILNADGFSYLIDNFTYSPSDETAELLFEFAADTTYELTLTFITPNSGTFVLKRLVPGDFCWASGDFNFFTNSPAIPGLEIAP